jgi:hypothetical protein
VGHLHKADLLEPTPEQTRLPAILLNVARTGSCYTVHINHDGLRRISIRIELTPALLIESSNDQDLAGGNGEGCSNTVSDGAASSCWTTHPKPSISHGLHPRGLELSIAMMRTWRCIDSLHLLTCSAVAVPDCAWQNCCAAGLACMLLGTYFSLYYIVA